MKVAPLIYNSLIRGYSFAIKLAAPFHDKARQLLKGHQNLLPLIEEELKKTTAPRVWFHCASLGEFEQGRPVMEAFKQKYPAHLIVLTFFSPSGYQVRKDYAGADFVFYLPPDTPDNAQRFIAAVKPQLVFFIKYEFWYHYLSQLHHKNISVVLISGIFRPGQLFFQQHGAFYRKMLHYFTHLFLQNKESVQLLKNIGITNTSLSGDTRFDRVADVCRNPKKIPLAEEFKNAKPLLVAGSTWTPDVEVLAPLLRHYKGRLKCIIAPHEVAESSLQETEKKLQGLKVERFSKTTEARAATADVLLIDNVGMLSALYFTGDFAYVGGGFGKGLHNILEAATFGMPVFFGNKSYQKFQEAKDLSAEGGAFPVENAAGLLESFAVLAEEEDKRKKAAEISARYVQQHTGATRQIMEYVHNLMKQKYAGKNI